MRQLSTEVRVPKPREEVFAFFGDAANLDRLTPKWLHFEILTPTPIEMGVGTLIDYRLRLRGIRINWRTEITAWEPPRYFEDRQLKGPYRHWLHKHTFEQDGDATFVRDDVDYAVPGWLFEPLVHACVVGPDVRRIFDYRVEQIREILGE